MKNRPGDFGLNSKSDYYIYIPRKKARKKRDIQGTAGIPSAAINKVKTHADQTVEMEAVSSLSTVQDCC